MKRFDKKKKTLNRDVLLQREELEVVQVDLGDDVCVFVRQMTGRERDTFERSLYNVVDDKREKTGVRLDRHLEDFRAKLCVCTICDDAGELLLRATDFDELSKNMSAQRLEKIVNVAQRINAISEEDKEELVKNSDAGLAGNSSSDSVES